ncbi:ABC transporter permease subunit [Pelagicoccus sp. SDUM812002]|uniref:ABC transporter permease subunit n=1 Tax=Pelagicoccus sp. SDUM812002 TaxID=3041266 RepID=UPI00281007F7|nr:ABC transporter permease subunit [Pelagicoccus sp. SDUM812002]MDQ8185985.1 ABC transporter permease subunit [Pelagicoccus sp. SDUM812002]
MKIRWPKFNPITRKRWKRFKSLKRSYYSFWLLIGLYLFSLLADVLFNEKPLFVRYDGESFFPLFFYYPDTVFTNSGLDTRPDYKKIDASDRFAEGSGNYMLFAPYPYGPNESITAAQIEVDESVDIVIRRQQLVGTIELDETLEIRRSVAGAPIFGVESDRDLRGLPLSEQLEVTPAFESAIKARLANTVSQPAFDEKVELSSGIAVELSLSPYEPRSRPPSSVRVTLREEVSSSKQETLRFLEESESIENTGTLWSKMSEADQQLVEQKAFERMAKRIQPMTLEIEGKSFEIDFEKEDVFFPFRPTENHWMGLDSSGRDVFSRLIHAMRISMNFGILLVAASMLIGIAAGAVQGYYGGKVDLLGQRSIEIWEALPFLYVMILLGSVLGQSFGLLLIVYALFSWIGISYYIRGEFLKLRKQPFVEAAVCLGLPSRKIILRHILPNAMVPVITFFPFSLVSAIGALSALDYLGFGLPAPTPSWGELFAQAQEFSFAWWLVLFPFLALFLVGLLGVFIGEGVRSAFDPRANTHYES